jgi:phosphatidylserine decarboxylase
VQRIPIAGTIEKLVYVSGKYLNITNDKYHDENERQLCLLKSKKGFDVIFVQIAGLVARRIVCNLKEGQEVKAGERFGCIKFGSRVDVYFPQNVELKVKVGQTMLGGESVIGVVNAKAKKDDDEKTK